MEHVQRCEPLHTSGGNSHGSIDRPPPRHAMSQPPAGRTRSGVEVTRRLDWARRQVALSLPHGLGRRDVSGLIGREKQRGVNPDNLRMQPEAVAFVQAFFDAGKPVAVICHGPWPVIEAGAARGRRIASWPSLKTDLRNAGAEWVDQEVVVDANLVSSRKPADIPAFHRRDQRVRDLRRLRQPGAGHGDRGRAGSPGRRMRRRALPGRRGRGAAARAGAPQRGVPGAVGLAAGQRSPGRAAGTRRCLSSCRRRPHHGDRALLRLCAGGQAARSPRADHGARRRRSAGGRGDRPRGHGGSAYAPDRGLLPCRRRQPDGGADAMPRIARPAAARPS